MLKNNREEAGFGDASLWEEAKKKGSGAMKGMIDRGLENTSVTVVLIGSETADREWVVYETKESRRCGNGLLGINIHSIKDQYGMPDNPGDIPFDRLVLDQSGYETPLSRIYPTYD